MDEEGRKGSEVRGATSLCTNRGRELDVLASTTKLVRARVPASFTLLARPV